MVEAMVASVIGVVGILGILGLLTDSLAKSTEIGDRFTATYLSAEGIEIVRGLIDENYTSQQKKDWSVLFSDLAFSSGPVPFQMQYNISLLDFQCSDCILVSERFVKDPANFIPMRKDSDGKYGYFAGTVTSFRRVISLDYDVLNEPKRLKIISRVDWSSRGKSYNVIMEDYIYDWERGENTL